MVRTIDILDLETEEHVATVAEDGTIDTFDSTGVVEEDLLKLLDDGRTVPYRDAATEVIDGEEVIAEKQHWIEPSEQGYLMAWTEILPYPYGVDWDAVDTDALEQPNPE